MMNLEIYLRPALALAIGLLIGLQREHTKNRHAGIRTFSLISLAGYLCGVLSIEYSYWIVIGGLFFLSLMFAVGNLSAAHNSDDDRYEYGLTTEVAVLLVYGIGVFLANRENDITNAVILSGVIALLLQYKRPMHRFVKALEKKDLKAIMQFVLITLVILPVLPNEVFGPFDVFNPFKAWLMVVLIVGIGLAGFLAYRFGGSRVGTVLSGALGGLVSSTATTVSASRFAKKKSTYATSATLIIMIATVVSIVRIMVELIAVDRGNFISTGPPLAVFLVAFTSLTFVLYLRRSDETVELEEPENPAELKPAIIFGVLYVLVLFLVAWSKDRFGEAGLYIVGILSGLTDMDAITLSTGELMNNGSLAPAVGWRVIMVAALSNLVFKGGIAAVIGGKALALQVMKWYGFGFAAGLLIIFLWPR